MTDRMNQPYASELFTITAGPQRQRCFVHADVLCQSDKFKATVQGNWKDSTDREIVLEDWDPETVGRMVQWLYTTHYNAPCPKDSQVHLRHVENCPPSASGNEINESQQAEENMTPQPLKPIGLMSHSGSGRQLGDHVPSNSIGNWALDNVIPTISKSRLNYGSIFQAHVKVYALASYVLLPPLEAFAFQRIQEVLVFIGPLLVKTPAVDNLVSLAQYLYTNTASYTNTQEPLRDLITTYIALNHASFESKQVTAFREECDEFVADVAAKFKQHVLYLEHKLVATEEELDRMKSKEDRRRRQGSWGPLESETGPGGGRGWNGRE